MSAATFQRYNVGDAVLFRCGARGRMHLGAVVKADEREYTPGNRRWVFAVVRKADGKMFDVYRHQIWRTATAAEVKAGRAIVTRN